MDRFDLPITRAEYQPNLAYLRKMVSLDRSARVSAVRILNHYGRAVTIYLRHSDLWLVGLDVGETPYHFADMPAIGNSTSLGFRSDYGTLGIRGRTIALTEPTIAESITHLSHHKAGRNGVNMGSDAHNALVRLIFIVPEALRNWMIERDVTAVLTKPGHRIVINNYWGTGRALNSWATWSAQENWPQEGVFLPHIPTKR